MPDLEMIELEEVEAKIAVVSSLNDTPKRSAVFEQLRREYSANSVAERVAAALDRQLTNGSLPA